MKKTVKMPDGSEVTFEGSPEEIADFERRQKSNDVSETPKKDKRKILLEEMRDLMKQVQLDRMERAYQPYWRYDTHSHCVGCAICKPVTPVGPWYPGVSWTSVGTVTLTQAQCDDPDVRKQMGVGPDELFISPGICVNKGENLS